MKKITVPVSGMHCRSCELVLEKSIKKLQNVEKVEANEKKWIVEISYNEVQPDMKEIEAIILENSYKIWTKKKLSWINTNEQIYIEFFIWLVAIGMLYVFFHDSKWLDTSSWLSDSTNSTFTPLLMGLAAGVSSCMAMVGGLILGASAKWNEEHLNKSRFHRFLPHIWLNLGRIIGFAIFGGILGYIGETLTISMGIFGTLSIIAALIMFYLGLNLTEISPKLSSHSFTLPKFLWNKVDNHHSKSPTISAFITGVLTFFLPCGFTFAMQLAAMQSGSMVTGSIMLGLFAIGTAPGLLGVGGLTAFFKGNWWKTLFRFMGVILIIISIWNFNNGLNLIPKNFLESKVTSSTKNTLETKNTKYETINLTYTFQGLSQKELRLKVGQSYKLVIDVKDTISGCMHMILIPGMDENAQPLNAGNIVTFDVTPKETGRFPLTCAMGVPHGYIIVE